jgi:hypothetical protein
VQQGADECGGERQHAMMTLACTASTWRMATEENSGKPNTTPPAVARGHQSPRRGRGARVASRKAPRGGRHRGRGRVRRTRRTSAALPACRRPAASSAASARRSRPQETQPEAAPFRRVHTVTIRRLCREHQGRRG